MFFNMYSFTKFNIFVSAPRLLTNIVVLEHACLYQRTGGTVPSTCNNHAKYQ